MPGKLQIQIAAPCHENWENMAPSERGRYCEACQKTVIDFSEMSDQEILRHLARVGQGVCGRFMPDQLERDIRVGDEPSKKKARWWSVLLAGVLTTLQVTAQEKTPKAVITNVARQPIAPAAIIPLAPVLVKDSFKVLPTATVVYYGRTTGLLKIVCTTTVEETGLPALDSLNLLPRWKVYPNPIARGQVVSLNWVQGVGEYRVDLFSTAGAMVLQRVMIVSNPGQVDLLEVPPTLAAGIYFLRVVRPLDGKLYTQKLVIL